MQKKYLSLLYNSIYSCNLIGTLCEHRWKLCSTCEKDHSQWHPRFFSVLTLIYEDGSLQMWCYCHFHPSLTINSSPSVHYTFQTFFHLWNCYNSYIMWCSILVPLCLLVCLSTYLLGCLSASSDPPDAPSVVRLSVSSSTSLRVDFQEPLCVNSAVVTKYKGQPPCPSHCFI